MKSLLIDIADPQAIRQKMPEIRKLYEAKEEEARRVSMELEGLRQLITSVVALSGGPHGPSPEQSPADTVPVKRTTARQTALEALRRAGRPMGPAALYRLMEKEGMEMPPNANALGASLYAAAQAGEAIRTGEGYAMRPLTDYTKAAEMGFPVPDQLHENPSSTGEP
jgi:hypothetical protein